MQFEKSTDAEQTQTTVFSKNADTLHTQTTLIHEKADISQTQTDCRQPCPFNSGSRVSTTVVFLTLGSSQGKSDLQVLILKVYFLQK